MLIFFALSSSLSLSLCTLLQPFISFGKIENFVMSPLVVSLCQPPSLRSSRTRNANLLGLKCISIYDIMYIIILDTHFYVPSKCADMRVCVLRSALSLSYQQIWIHLYEDDVHLLPQPYKDFRPQIIKRYLTAANKTRNYCCFVSPKSDDGTEIWWLVIVCMMIVCCIHTYSMGGDFNEQT